MDGLALLCNLHADGPLSLRRLREAGIAGLDELSELADADLARTLKASPSQARRFREEARLLGERLRELPLESEFATEAPIPGEVQRRFLSLIVRRPIGFDTPAELDALAPDDERSDAPVTEREEAGPSELPHASVTDLAAHADTALGYQHEPEVFEPSELAREPEPEEEPQPTLFDAGLPSAAPAVPPTAAPAVPPTAAPAVPPTAAPAVRPTAAPEVVPRVAERAPTPGTGPVPDAPLKIGEIEGLDPRTCQRLVAEGVLTYRKLVDLASLSLARRSGISLTRILDLRHHAQAFLAKRLSAPVPAAAPRGEARPTPPATPAPVETEREVVLDPLPRARPPRPGARIEAPVPPTSKIAASPAQRLPAAPPPSLRPSREEPGVAGPFV